MIDKDLLQILACPDTRQSLKEADSALIEKVNDAIASGKVTNKTGDAVTERIDAGLVREDGQVLYAIREGIPVLLPDEAIDVTGLG